MPIRSGDVIDGKYRLERTLGIGGMGIVFEAHHIELEVRRAIKIMQPPRGNHTGPDNVDPNAQVRFLREARAAARIVSEHVAQVYDVGVLESGERYMVIEYLSGTDLERLVRKRGPLSADKTVAYVLQACSGISEAHKLGIIHRDIKSSNLFLTESEVIKVIDWGLAKQTLNGETGITQANHVVGSLEYMSPEQLNGAEVDARTDIWSLGVVLHELVTGKLPFTGATCGEIIHNILCKEPTATTWMSEISLALDAIVRRCLQKDRNLRYPSVDELVRALRSVVIPRPSLQNTLEMSNGGMLAQASLSDASTSERLSNRHEQETAVQRHRRDRLTGSSTPTVSESQPGTGSQPGTDAKIPERGRHTPRSRAALYALAAMVLFVLMRHTVPAPEQPPPSFDKADAMHGTSHTDGVIPAPKITAEREPSKRNEPPHPVPPRRDREPKGPESQLALPTPPPAPRAQPTPRHAAKPPVDKSRSEPSPSQSSPPRPQEDRVSKEVSPVQPRPLFDPSSGHGDLYNGGM